MQHNIKTTRSIYLFLMVIALMPFSYLMSDTASASKYKMKCDGPYQLVQGNWISTPPCEEIYMVKIARTYGVRVTVSQIRNNPNKKIEICEFLNHDTRIRNICGAYGNYHFSHGR